METNKLAAYTKKEIDLAKYAKALGHPARVAILNLLIDKQTCFCGDIVDELPIAQSTVSQHLKELKDAGLIKGEIEGASVCYCIDEKIWSKAQKLILGLFDKFSTINSKCC
jgi:DNA-binding transcriptional ArsR family regulator